MPTIVDTIAKPLVGVAQIVFSFRLFSLQPNRLQRMREAALEQIDEIVARGLHHIFVSTGL
jgi:F0F1-type ATP synthase membrane subunit a